MDRKYSCLQYIPLSAAILLDLATEHWFGAMDSGQYAETILKTFDKSQIYRLTSHFNGSLKLAGEFRVKYQEVRVLDFTSFYPQYIVLI